MGEKEKPQTQPSAATAVNTAGARGDVEMRYLAWPEITEQVLDFLHNSACVAYDKHAGFLASNDKPANVRAQLLASMHAVLGGLRDRSTHVIARIQQEPPASAPPASASMSAGVSDAEEYEGENRYVVVRAGFWWKVKIGDGTALYGRYYTETEAMRMAALLRREYETGKFVAERARANTRAGVLFCNYYLCAAAHEPHEHKGGNWNYKALPGEPEPPTAGDAKGAG